jgi:hypothetical protein
VNEKTINKFMNNEITKYINVISENVIKTNLHFMINKFFIFPTGINNAEIFLYCKIIWSEYFNKCGYKLDGLIFTPINQKYTKVPKETLNKIYKWKPSNLNSIDFYITFEKNQNG